MKHTMATKLQQRCSAPVRFATALLLSCLCGSAIAQNREDPRLTADPSLFLSRALQSGMTEIELGNQAQQRSKSSDLKSFALRMTRDHRQINDAIAALAAARRIKTPTDLDPEHRKIIDEVSSKGPAEFDAAYVQHLVADHAKAITLFTQASQERDPALAALANKMLPTLKAHKQTADALAARFPTPEGNSSRSTSER